jgi:hypothetical protein
MNNSVFWDKSKARKNQHATDSDCWLFHAGFLLGLLFDPEDKGDIFL